MLKDNSQSGLSQHLSPVAAWAFAVGTSVGWGLLVVTGSTYLDQAGPLGSVIGLLIGAAVMLALSRNFHYLTMDYPGAGGVYAFTKNVFGYDRAFLISWFSSLTYAAILWANATSLPLFARYFIGDTFRFGFLYSVFGYDVYLGEALLSVAAVVIIALLCICSGRLMSRLMVALAAVFILAIAVYFGASLIIPGGGKPISPAFVPERSEFSQFMKIAFISPWAFIGFESIVNSSGEFTFRRTKTFRILTAAVLTATALYIAVTLLSVTAYPSEYSSWLEYIRDLGNLQGIKALPAFYAAQYYLGDIGTALLSAALLSLVITSLIGNTQVLSRMFYALAQDDIISSRFTAVNKNRVPYKCVLLVAAVSLVIPFVGRTAIGWIVDVTTLGATLIYGFVSAAAFKQARRSGDKTETFTGALGFAVMVIFGAFMLFGDLFSGNMIGTETYFLFIVWSIAGLVYFRYIIAKDHARRFGKAIIVWIALLSLIVFLAMIWSGRSESQVAQRSVDQISAYYNGTADPAVLATDENTFISSVLEQLNSEDSRSMFIMFALLTLSLVVMLSNHFTMRKWEAQTVRERDSAREIAYRDPLTGVKSKNAFAEKEAELDLLIDNGECDIFGLVVCDVNGLKHINDTLGHKAGDELIRDAGALICGHFKHSPVYRIGGDEFVILLEGADLDNRVSLLKEINEVIESHIASGGVVVSLGTAVYYKGEDYDFHSVFERADAAMYERKLQLKSMGAVTRE